MDATTRAGSLTSPLRDHFGIAQHLKHYSITDFKGIVQGSASYLNLMIDEKGTYKIKKHARGTLRITIRLLCCARDYTEAKAHDDINVEVELKALNILDIDN